MIKSRPVYAPFKLDLSGRVHLIVTNQAEPPEGIEDSLGEIEIWTVRPGSLGVPAPAAAHIRAFRATAELLPQLGHRLTRETAGLRFYAIGSEAFIWDAYNIAVKAGLGTGEIFLHRAGPLVRRVYCTHCRTLTEDVAQNILPCPACGAMLFVRDHFSRRLAAFMGVKVDAEVPGEIPAPEVFVS